MPRSEAQKRADKRYYEKNRISYKEKFKIFSVKMPVKDAQDFASACIADSITPHSVFLAAARAQIAKHQQTDTFDTDT